MQNEKQTQLRKVCEDFMDKVAEIAGTDWLESRTNIKISIHSLPDEFFTDQAKENIDHDFYNKNICTKKSESLIKSSVHLFSKSTTTKVKQEYVQNESGEFVKTIES